MSVDHPKPYDSRTADGPVQFSLGSIIALTAFVAVVSSLIFSVPSVVATPLLMLLTVALPVALTSAVIHGRGSWRAFCIGALFPAVAMLLCTSLMLLIHSVSAYQNGFGSLRHSLEGVGPYYRPYVAVTLTASVLMGMLSDLVRYLAQRNR